MYSSLLSTQPIFEVLQPGLQTAVQDNGRHGYRVSGVPESGALDRFALNAANVLVGNEPRAAALELLLTGLTIRPLAATTLAITGADLGATLDGVALATWTAFPVEPGQCLTFARRRSGARAYLAVAGGIAVDPVLGARSTYLPGGWGGFNGRTLRRGDILRSYRSPSTPLGWLSPDHRPAYRPMPVLRCIAGPHLHLFSSASRQAWDAATYTLSNECDRMGYRLQGPALDAAAATLPSLGVLPGVVQVPPGQAPIVLLADAQTTGGYPIIATVISADLPLAAQLLPGDCLSFQLVSTETARLALAEQQCWLQPPLELLIEGGPV